MKWYRLRRIISIMLLTLMVFVLVALPVLAADSLVASAIQDTYIQQHNPDSNFNYADAVVSSADLAPSDWVQRGLLEMDISSLPSNATITDATLKLYYFSWLTANPTGRTVWIYKLSRTDWVESEATWNSYKSGSSWASAGGDYVTTNPSGSSVTLPADSGAWVEWDITALVQDAHSNGNDVELLMKFAIETDVDTTAKFEGYEYGSNPPELHITYTTPDASATRTVAGTSMPLLMVVILIIFILSALASGSFIFAILVCAIAILALPGFMSALQSGISLVP